MTATNYLIEEATLHSPATPKMGPHPGYYTNLSTTPFNYSPHRETYNNDVDQSQENIQNANAIDCGGLKQQDLLYVKCN